MTTRELQNSQLSAIILAGGDGTRLRSLSWRITGQEVPKQFCQVLGDETLLDQTRKRVSLIIPPTRTVTVFTRRHKRFYIQSGSDASHPNFAVQPDNRGTAPAILFALFRLIKLGQQGTVAIFPSDHYVSDDHRFMSHVEAASAAASDQPSSIVLLGIPAERPETQYGWIEPAQPIDFGTRGPSRVLPVRRFWEKPSPELAVELWKRGFLWNSFVLVARITALIDLFVRALPQLYIAFAQSRSVLDTASESEAMDQLYTNISTESFAERILVDFAHDLSVLPVCGVKWNDLGEPQRVLATLDDLGIRPNWLATLEPTEGSKNNSSCG
jgi:mannose-1-phosphate guanylyltransferase